MVKGKAAKGKSKEKAHKDKKKKQDKVTKKGHLSKDGKKHGCMKIFRELCCQQ